MSQQLLLYLQWDQTIHRALCFGLWIEWSEDEELILDSGQTFLLPVQ